MFSSSSCITKSRISSGRVAGPDHTGVEKKTPGQAELQHIQVEPRACEDVDIVNFVLAAILIYYVPRKDYIS
jgi:hypothetical protein